VGVSARTAAAQCCAWGASVSVASCGRPAHLSEQEGRVLPNVWLGTSVENADYVWRIDWLRQTPASVRFISFEPLIGPVGQVDLTDIHRAIVGGESGPAARPMCSEWVRELKTACGKQRVAFFFKQWGGPRKKKSGRLLEGRTWDEYPSRVQFPAKDRRPLVAA
jgi:protein gp37